MDVQIALDSITLPFEILEKREIEGGIFIAPLVAGIVDTQEEF